MIAVILKELRQMCHGAKLPEVAALLAAAALALGILRHYMAVPRLYFLLFHLAILITCVVLIAIAAHRWKKERGDTALDMTLTTTLPVWQVIFGKFIALYAPVLLLLLLDRSLDLSQGETSTFQENLAADAVFFAALASAVPAVSSIRSKRGGGLDWGETLAYLLAFPWIAHRFMLFAGVVGGRQLPELMPFYRMIIFAASFVVIGFLIALAGARKPGEDRMRELHIFFLLSAWILPALYWYFGDEEWLAGQGGELLTCASLFLLASLFERGEVTHREKRSWAYPFFATGSIFAWLWGIILAIAAYFIAPHTDAFWIALGGWFFLGVYVALVRCVGAKWPTWRIAVLFYLLYALATTVSGAVQLDHNFAYLGIGYFQRFRFDAKFFGMLFALSVLLRSREIYRFVKSCRA